MTLDINTQVDHYRILECKFQGTVISEYLAEDIQTGEKATFRLFWDGREISDSFSMEFGVISEHLSKLDHPGLEKIVGYGRSTCGHYVVCEDYDAKPLSQFSRPLPAKYAAQILEQVAGALLYLHEHNVVHGNLSLENILVLGEQEVKVKNFGFDAIINRELIWSLPDSYMFLAAGNPAGRSPEQLSGREATIASDIYGIGAVFFELISGLKPFSQASAVETALNKENLVIGWPNKLPPKTPKSAIKLVHKCVAVDPSARFSQMAKVQEAFNRLANGKSARIRVTKRMMAGAPKQFPVVLAILTLLVVLAAGGLWAYYQLSYLPAAQMITATAQSAYLTSLPTTTPTITQSPTPTVPPTLTPTLTPTSTPTSTPTPKPTYQATLGVNNVSRVKLLSKFSFQAEAQRAFAPQGVSALKVKDMLIFSPDSRYLAASGLRQRSVIIDTQTYAKIATVDGWIPPGDPFTPDNRSVLVVRGLDPKTLGIVNLSGEYSSIGEYPDEAAVDYVYNDTLIAASRNNRMRMWDVSTNLEIDISQGPEFGCQVARSINNAEFLAAYSPAGIFDHWDEVVRSICQSSNKAVVTVSIDRSKIAYVNANGLVEVDDAASKQMLWRELTRVTTLEFSPDGTILAGGQEDGSVVLWNAQTGNRIFSLSQPGINRVTAIRFSPNHKMIAYMDDQYNIALFGLFTID